MAKTSHAGHVLDYVMVSQRFWSSMLDTKVFQKIYFQSEHRLVVSLGGELVQWLVHLATFA